MSEPISDDDVTRIARIAFQGERGAFSEEAVIAYCGLDIDPTPYRDNLEAARSVETGECDAAVLPVENSIAGTVTASYDALLACSSLHVTGEVVLRIRHNLLAPAGASMDTIRRVESHPVALAQCRLFLDRHPRIDVKPSYDTAGAAHDVAAAADISRAAIASRAAAMYYGLDVIAPNIEDRDDNQTRFVVVRRTPAVLETGVRSRSILVLTTPNVPGALLAVLRPIADSSINLSKLESRPTGEPWSYQFIVEMEHDAHSPATQHALDAIRSASLTCRILGTYALER